MSATMHSPLSETERRNRLRLARTETVGPVTFRELLQRFGSAGDAIDALPELARRSGRRRPLAVPSTESIAAEFDAVERHGGRLIVLGDPDYPAPLAATDDAPVSLSLVGDRSLLQRAAVAIVGARNASSNGRSLARRIAAEIGAAGFVVVSGMARGIDAAAHEGSLDGGTLAVLAGGVDIVYPRENAALYDAIRERGLLVSEMPCGVQPQARHFPRRNRIIAGMCLGVLVVEAALKSGSLITARLAGEQGRDVFAIPGSPLDPRCRGANDLIRNGAILTECADDILAEIVPARERAIRHIGASSRPGAFSAPSTQRVTDGPADSDLSERIAELLGPTPQSVDSLIRESGVPSAAVWATLLDLELAGRIERLPGNKVVRIFE